MQVFVISLPDARERRRHVAARMAEAGVRFRFFDAIDGATAQHLYADRIRPLKFRIHSRRPPVASEVGCYASHLALWERCVELGRPIVVLEDDFEFLSPDFARLLAPIEHLTSRYGFLRLQPPRRHAIKRGLRCLLRPNPPTHPIASVAGLTVCYIADMPTSTVGYALAPNAAAALAAYSHTLDAPVDRFLQWTWRHRVPLHGIEPPLIGISSAAATSTIGMRSRSRNPFLLTARLLVSVRGKILRRRFNLAYLRADRAAGNSPEPQTAHADLARAVKRDA